jgi:hypothetical protein
LTDHSTANSVESAPSSTGKRGQGLPLWMPLVGLIIALLFAIFVGVRVVPTLSGVVLPPDPPLPAGAVSMLSHEGKGVGLDEWLYGTTRSGCQVARYYEQRFGYCLFDPDSNCERGGVPPMQAGSSSFIARCDGKDTFGAYQATWTVYISSGYAEQGQTHFRVIREVGN